MTGTPVFDTANRIAANHVFGDGAVLSAGLPMTTTAANAVIVILVVNTADAANSPANFTTVASVTGGSLTFAKYTGANLSGVSYSQATVTDPFFANSTGGIDLEVWWAHAPGILSGVSFTVTMNDPIQRCGISGIAVYGCLNPAAPWDPDGALPAISSAPTGGVSISLTTALTYDALMLFTADIADPVVNPDPDPAFVITGVSGFAAAGNVDQVGGITPMAPSFEATLIEKASTVIVTGLPIGTATLTGPLNAIIFIGAALHGVPPIPPPRLNLDNVVVTSLLAESPCTVAQYATPPLVAPAVGLRWSDTRGATFGEPVARGLFSDPLTQLQWNRTGYARDRLFELFWSAAARTALNGAFVIQEPWDS
jgi:hypothetical protein